MIKKNHIHISFRSLFSVFGIYYYLFCHLLEHTVVALAQRLKRSVELRGTLGYVTVCLKPYA